MSQSRLDEHKFVTRVVNSNQHPSLGGPASPTLASAAPPRRQCDPSVVGARQFRSDAAHVCILGGFLNEKNWRCDETWKILVASVGYRRTGVVGY